MNASTLLDGVLDSGRADAVALITEDGDVSYRSLASMVAAVACVSAVSSGSSASNAS